MVALPKEASLWLPASASRSLQPWLFALLSIVPETICMQLLAGSVCTFLFGVLFTFIVRRVALATGMVAQPRVDRWHKTPTALCGGVAIYLAFVLGWWLFADPVPGKNLILAGGTLLFLLGLVDDFRAIKPQVKLVVQLAVAAIVVFFGRRLPWTNNEALNIAITIFFIVGITNALNLLDNMDGLAGGVAVIACEFLTITLLLNGQYEQALLPALLGGAVLGFLLFDLNPASIFMGDCGSLFLGFTLSAVSLLSDHDRTRNLFSVLLTPVLLLLLPIFDTCLVMVSRKVSGRSIAQGGRDHASHRLVALGLSERRAVWLLYALAALAGALTLLVRNVQAQILLWLIPCLALAVLLLGVYLGKVRVYEPAAVPVSDTLLRKLETFTYKRRVFEILLDVMLVALAYYGAYLLRFDGGLSATQMGQFVYSLPLVIALQMLLFLVGGVYRGLWHYMGLEDLFLLAKPVLGGALGCAGILTALFGGGATSPAVLILYPILLFGLVTLSRLSFRLLRLFLSDQPAPHPDVKPVLIYGADDEGAFLLRRLLQHPEHHRHPIGFVDDNDHLTGKFLSGYRIYTSEELVPLLRAQDVQEVWIVRTQVPEPKLQALRDLGLRLKHVGIRIETEAELRISRTSVVR